MGKTRNGHIILVAKLLGKTPTSGTEEMDSKEADGCGLRSCSVADPGVRGREFYGSANSVCVLGQYGHLKLFPDDRH